MTKTTPLSFFAIGSNSIGVGDKTGGGPATGVSASMTMILVGATAGGRIAPS